MATCEVIYKILFAAPIYAPVYPWGIPIQRNNAALIKTFSQRDREPLYIASEHHRMVLPCRGPERTITGRVSRLRGLRSRMHSLRI